MSEFQDQVVIVTGGAKGIGAGIGRAFAREGARVLCADVDVVAGELLASESTDLAGEIQFEEGDVTQDRVCKSLVETAVSQWGRLDVVCNNVGIQPTNSYVPAHELAEELWDRIIDINLKSCFLMTRHSVPEMQKRGGGVIINTASVQGLQSMKGVSAYAASKGGMLSLTRQLALEYAEDKIRVLAVNPGTIDTPLFDEAIAYSGEDLAKAKKRYGEAHPLGKIGTPEDIAEAFLFLASKRARFITGEYLCVDGGVMAKGAWA